MKQHNDGWPELTYRYIEHYYWEPDHLLHVTNKVRIAQLKAEGKRPIDQVYEGLRTQEVPLNYLLNVLLRIAPSSVRHNCLEPFGVILSDPGLATLALKTPCDHDFVQPDVHLESETSRVFIEVKTKAELELKQIKKYVRLHTKLDEIGGAKRAYVLFLVKPDVLTLSDIRQSFTHARAGEGLATLLGPEAGGITFGSTTWAAFARMLAEEMERRCSEPSEAAEMLAVLIGDFLADLQTRHLLPVQALD